MEETGQDNRWLWFAFGYFVCIAVELIAFRISQYLSSLESQGVVVSMNGTADESGTKKVTETIEQVEETKERLTNE